MTNPQTQPAVAGTNGFVVKVPSGSESWSYAEDVSQSRCSARSKSSTGKSERCEDDNTAFQHRRVPTQQNVAVVVVVVVVAAVEEEGTDMDDLLLLLMRAEALRWQEGRRARWATVQRQPGAGKRWDTERACTCW